MAKDIILNDDIQIVNGDLLVEFSDEQHIEHILLAKPGDYKNVPWIGIGIESYLQAPITGKTTQLLEKEIKLHLESDTAKKVNVKVDKLLQTNVEAIYD